MDEVCKFHPEIPRYARDDDFLGSEALSIILQSITPARPR
jgi:hypothetical protein